jgi:antibiotic biosynthesis monooxygenase (ABM) superfamily enzyme
MIGAAHSDSERAAGQVGPPRWKTMIVIWLSVYPLVTMVAALLGPHIRDLPVPLQTLVMTVLLVPAMSLVMLPLVSRLLAGFLRS